MRRLTASALIFYSVLSPMPLAAQSQTQFAPQTIEPFALERGSVFEASGSGPGRRVSRTAAAMATEFAAAEAIIRQNHFAGSRVPAERLTKSTLMGALRTLDPHSRFYGPAEWGDFLLEEKSTYTGIGATISEYQRGSEVATYIVAATPGGAAQAAGLKFGDKILAINGKSVAGKDGTEVRDMLRGPDRTAVSITLERAASLLRETVTLKRTAVPQPSVPDHYMIEKGVGYISLTEGFTLTTVKEFELALASLRNQGMTSLVLDLRGNGGGIVEKAVKVVENFLPRGTLILTQRGRMPDDNRVWRSANPKAETCPLVLLVDESTASAAEIVAGALQDNDRALIVGGRTYGKGLVQSVIELPEARGLTLTSARYLMPSGRSIQRDYSVTGLYDYFKHADRTSVIDNPYTETRTTTNRRVTGGDGIAPDEVVERPDLTARQARLIDPIFFFMRDVSAGRIREGSGRASAAIDAFADFAARHPEFGISQRDISGDAAFVDRRIRFTLETITGGVTAGVRVLNRADPQTQRAIQLLPAAQELYAKAKAN
jgi:carboxyl-terminal processing protease